MTEVLDRDGSLLRDRMRMASHASVASVSDSEADPDKSRQQQDAWDEILDGKLIGWGVHPEQFDDDEIESPSRDVVSLAFKVALLSKNLKLPAPDSVRTDAQGGIVFEIKGTSRYSTVIHVWDDLDVECQAYDGKKLVERFSLDLES